MLSSAPSVFYSCTPSRADTGERPSLPVASGQSPPLLEATGATLNHGATSLAGFVEGQRTPRSRCPRRSLIAPRWDRVLDLPLGPCSSGSCAWNHVRTRAINHLFLLHKCVVLLSKSNIVLHNECDLFCRQPVKECNLFSRLSITSVWSRLGWVPGEALSCWLRRKRRAACRQASDSCPHGGTRSVCWCGRAAVWAVCVRDVAVEAWGRGGCWWVVGERRGRGRAPASKTITQREQETRSFWTRAAGRELLDESCWREYSIDPSPASSQHLHACDTGLDHEQTERGEKQEGGG